MTDPAIVSALCLALEKVANKAIHYDAGTKNKLSKLNGTIIHLQSNSPELSLYFSFPTLPIENLNHSSENHIHINAYSEEQITVRVSGTLSNMFLLLLSPGDTSYNLANSGVNIFGNSGKLSELRSVFQDLDIDWEQFLIELTGSPLIGTVPGHQLSVIISKIISWLSTSEKRMRKNIGQYLVEELRATPGKTELDEFYLEVNNVRTEVERLNARIISYANKI